MLSEILKDLSQRQGFIDYFSEALERSQKKKTVLKNFDEIMKLLDLPVPTHIIIALSLSFATDEAMKQKGVSYLKQKIKEYPDPSKQTDIPDHLVPSIIRFIRTCDKHNLTQEEINTWVSLNQKTVRQPEFMTLGAILNPNIVLSSEEFQPVVKELSDTEQKSFLKDILFELGPAVTHEEEMLKALLNDIGKTISDKEVALTINMMVENNPFVEQGNSKELHKNVRSSYSDLLNSEIKAQDPNFQEKQFTQWNYLIFIKVLSNLKKVQSWATVLKSIDSPDFYLSSRKSFQEFSNFYDILKETQKTVFPRELFCSKWDNFKTQINFIERFLENARTDLSMYKDLKNKNLIEYDSNPPVRNTQTFISMGMDVWLNKDFVARLIELSESHQYNTIKSLFDPPMKRYPEIILATLSQIHPKSGNALLENIFNTLFPEFMDNATSHTKIIDYIFKNNLDILSRTFAKVCKQEKSSLNLSRILDISQNIKGLLQKLALSEDYDFSLPLGLFASKREFFNLKVWVKEKIENQGERFIEALIDYIKVQVLAPVTAAKQPDSTEPISQKKLESILENAYLNGASLGVLLESLTASANSTSRESYSDLLIKKIQQLKESLEKVLPDRFNSTSTSKVEADSSKLLGEVFNQTIDLTKFLDKLVELKKSTKEHEKEVFACIIHNLFVEYPYFPKMSKPMVELTGKIFGNLIKREIPDAMTYKVCLQSILDALKKKDKLFVLGINAVNEFKSMIHMNPSACKNLFEIDQMRETHPRILFEILQNMRTHNPTQLGVISPVYIDDIENRIRMETQQAEIRQSSPSPQQVAPVQAVQEKPEQSGPQIIPASRIDTTTLADEINKQFLLETENLMIAEDDKKESIFTLNQLDKDKLDEKARKIVPSKNETAWINWFSCYLVWKRIPTDKAYLELYRDLITKINKKGLTAKVLACSYQLMNIVMEYSTYRKQNIPTEEMNWMRNCGTWFGTITLGSNRPIIRKDLDIKMLLYKSLENKSLVKAVPLVCSIMATIIGSQIFKWNNPYIMGLLGVLLEIKNEQQSGKNNVTMYVEHLLKELNISEEKDIKHFGFVQRKRNLKNTLPLLVRSLAESIYIDMRALESYTTDLDTDLGQLVAIALDLSIRDITKPAILSRSVSIALTTTREMVLKDYAFEPDEEKIMKAAEQMVSKLAGNLALVTCTEPLKTSIKDYLENHLRGQTALSDRARKNIKDIATSDNLNLACSIVRKLVVERALFELNKDKEIQQAVEKRKRARENRERFIDEKYTSFARNLPPIIRPNHQGITINDHKIYTSFANDYSGNGADPEIQPQASALRRVQPQPANNYQNYPGNAAQNHHQMPERRVQEDPHIPVSQPHFHENDFIQYLRDLDSYIMIPNNEERLKSIHTVYKNISKMLTITQNQHQPESSHRRPPDLILEALFKINQQAAERIRCYSDILVICCNYNPKLTKYITEWFFNAHIDTKYNHTIITIFLRRNLFHLQDFDTGYAQVLETVETKNHAPLDCIVMVLKCLVIEQRIFAIYTFKKIVEKLTGFQRKKLINQLPADVAIFIETLAEFMKMSHDYTCSIQLRLSHLEPQYKKLLRDVEEYFLKPDFAFYKQAMQMFKRWLKATSENELGYFIQNFEEEITRKPEAVTISFFCYIIDVSCKQSERFYFASRKMVKLDYSYIDQVSKMVTILMKAIASNPKLKINLLENILTAIIIVMTKEHHYNTHNFNNKVFFKLMFNILYDLNWPDYGFQTNIRSMLLTIVQALHIMQPIKYPGFAFAWLQLVSCKYLMGPLLRDNHKEDWNNYSTLIQDLIIFYKEVFTAKSMNTPEMKQFYKGTLRLLLVLLHDFPDFLCSYSFSLLEEIPDNFMQVKNIMVSAYPKGMRIPDPFEQENQLKIDSGEEYNKMPIINIKIEERINSHNLHSLITNCIKNPDQSDFDNIMKSFYISGYKGDTHINKILLDSFVLYVPYYIHTQSSQDQTRLDQYKHDSYMLFVKLIKESDFELRDAIINSMFNNLRYPNQITFYFTHLILLFFTNVDNEHIHEQIVRNLFERLIIEKPHPWGILFLLDKLFTDRKYNFESSTFYQKNSQTMENLITFVLDFVKIQDPTNIGEGEIPALN